MELRLYASNGNFIIQTIKKDNIKTWRLKDKCFNELRKKILIIQINWNDDFFINKITEVGL